MTTNKITRRDFVILSSLSAGALIGGCNGPKKDFLNQQSSDKPCLSFGAVADIQYADVDPVPKYDSYYRPSLGKLQDSVDYFNSQKLDFVVQLGDYIDRGRESFAPVHDIYNQIKTERYHVIGNHDLESTGGYPTVLKEFNLDNPYYTFEKGGILFVVLDTSDISLLSRDPGSEKYKLAQKMLESQKENGYPNAVPWNAAISQEQLNWLDETLAKAQSKSQKVIVFAHHRILPINDNLTIWNGQELVDILDKHSNVKAFINGHDHRGGYDFNNGLHYLTVDGMMATPDTNAFAAIDIYPDKMVVKGYGRVESRTLKFR